MCQTDAAHPPEFYTEAECRAMLDAFSPKCVTGARNRALIAVLWRAGLRSAEALDLLPADVDTEAGIVRVRRGKGGYPRTVGLDPAACEIVQAWMHKRAGLGISGPAPLFCALSKGARGNHLATSNVRDIVRKAGKKAGIEKRVHVHGLRHSMAVGMVMEGMRVDVVQRAMGHQSIATTARYLDKHFPKDVVDEMRGREWGV